MTITVTITDWVADRPELLAMLGTATTPPGTGQTPPPPADTNVYPLTMPAVTDGSPVTLGTGPDQIQLRLSSQPNEATNCVLAVLIDGRWIAGPLTVSAHSGADAGQVFTVRGAFGPLPHTVSLNNIDSGLANLWVNAVSFNAVPLVFNGPATYRGGVVNVNSPAVWLNNAANTDWTLPVPVAPPVVVPPAPVPAQSEITGAAVNGAAFGSPVTLAEAIASTPAAGELTLPSGTFVGVAALTSAITVTGAGLGKTIIDCTGLPPMHSKAVFVFSAPGATISNLTIKGAAISASDGGNAAGVRDDAAGDDFTLDSVGITGCQDGILTGGSNVTLTNCHIHDNGAGNPGSGPTHELYFGNNPNADPKNPTTITLTGCIITCGALATHALKSRAAVTLVESCAITANASGDGGANSGRAIDIPNGGSFTMTGGTVTLPATAAVTSFFGYGVDNQSNPRGAVKFSGVVFDDKTGTGGSIQCFAPPIDIDVTGCTYTGPVAPQLTGWRAVTGEIVKA